jgi:hypothetical protein
VVAEKVLGSVEFDGAAPLDPLAIHGVSIGRMEGMEVWPIMSQPILLREPGVEPPFPPDKASLALVIAPLPKPNPTDEELGLYLGGMLKDLKPDMNQVKSRDTTVSGVPSVELVVPGENDGEPVMIYGFVVRTKDSLFGGFGHVGQKRADVFMPKFAKIVESIRLDDSVLGPLPR